MLVSLVIYLGATYQYILGKNFTRYRTFSIWSFLWITLTMGILLTWKKQVSEKRNKVYRVLSTIFISTNSFFFSESIYQKKMYQQLRLRAVLITIIVVTILSLCLQKILLRCRIVLYGQLLVALLFGCANYYMIEFKGNVLRPCELLAWNTGLKVAGGYTYAVTDRMQESLIAIAFGILIIRFNKDKIVCKHSALKNILVGGGLTFGCIFLIFSVSWSSLFKLHMDAWEMNNTYYQNGTFLAFIMEIQCMNVEKPQNYSVEEVEHTLSSYGEETVTDEGELPNIICIMNESFADLSVLGPIDTSVEMQAYHQINDYVKKGNVYVPVYGGGTCNSEFEFLTGNSIGNLSKSMFPYQSVSLEKIFNLAEVCRSVGYDTIAFHPNYKSAWNREKVYDAFGIEKFLGIEDVQDAEYMRYYMSDRANYENIIELYNESRSVPKFIFNVTLQNHGGYDDINLLDKMKLVGIEEYSQYPDVITYRTLIRESCQALYDFLEYFRNIEQKIIVCFFGDHLPKLDEEFVEEIYGYSPGKLSEETELLEKRYKVPYMIWANYETDADKSEKDISLNYLGAVLMDIVGIHNPYIDYLLDLQKKIPVINAYGYQTADGVWHSPEEENKDVEEYKRVGYYMMQGS